MSRRIYTPLAAALALAACTPASPGTGPAPEGTRMASADPLSGTLPPIPAVRGPLRIDVVYPAEDARLTASDSNFVFGSVGTGEARLTINGAAVEVAPNGAFLAFVPVPRDGVYRVAANAGAEHATAVRRIRPPEGAGETTSGIAALAPRAAMTVQRGERVTVRFRGAPGGRARIVFPDGSTA
ncbi:MAG TPA: hypothetical protein VF710_14015, partial [Longimicrobium sp.]